MLGVYIPLVVVATLCAALFMDNLSQARNEKWGMRDATKEPQLFDAHIEEVRSGHDEEPPGEHAPAPRPSLEQEQPEQSERHRDDLGEGSIAQAVDERSEEAGRRLEPALTLVNVMVLVSVCAPRGKRAVDRLVQADGRDEEHAENRRDEARANGRAETTAELQSDPGGDERDREREQRVAEHVPEVASGAVVLRDAENDRVVRVLPADHAEREQRGQE
jgi:hypothetical protein